MPAPFVPFPHDLSETTRKSFQRGYDEGIRGDELDMVWLAPRRKLATVLAYMAGRDAGAPKTA